MLRSVFLALALLTAPCAWTQGEAPLANEIITVARDGYTISGLATYQAGMKDFKYAVALFPGYPSILRLREEDGKLRFDLGGNFLVRSRRHWLDTGTLTLVIDAPSDEWFTFAQHFRAGARYGADLAALLEEASRRYAVRDWTFVGTSEGSVTAFHAARMNPQLAKRLILTASLLLPTRNGAGLSDAEWSALKLPLLWVHHEDDPCSFTAYDDAQKYAARSNSPLVTVRGGGPGHGQPCEAFSRHGFVGQERQVVHAMRAWVQTGVVPPDVR